MEVVEAFAPKMLKSNSDGTMRVYIGKPIPAALAAKMFKLYLWVSETDSNVKLTVYWAHSADGVYWKREESSPLIDTSTGSVDAAVGMYDGDNGSTTFGAWVRFVINIEERVSPSTQVTATASLHSVFKPF